MSRRRWWLLVIVALLLPTTACGDQGESPFASATTTTAGATSPFVGTPGTLPNDLETIVIDSAGNAFTLPAAACLDAPGAADIVLAAAQQQAAEVRSLVGRLVSGWPTTTYALDFDHEGYERDLQAAGVAALTLAGLLGEEDALTSAWADWEETYSDPEGGWGPPDEISSRVAQWQAEAHALRRAVAVYCPAG